MADRAVIVVGGSIAALVAAAALRRAGRRVELLLPHRGVGGSFASPQRDGCNLDLGMRLLELGYGDAPAAAPSLAGYRPGPDGHRPYAGLVDGYLRELLGDDVVEVERPQLHLGGAWHPDILFTVDLRGLPDLLPAALAPAIAREVSAARAVHGDAGVLALPGEQLAALTLEQASRVNHGATLHEALIGPLCDKVCTQGAGAAQATLARKLWMPLFWPRTLDEALTGAPLGFCPDRRFHTVAGGGPAEIVRRLLERAGGRTVGALVEATADELRFDDGTAVPAAGAILGSGPDELFGAAGSAPELGRATSVVAWLDVADEDTLRVPSMAHVADPDEPVFRVSRNGHQPSDGRTVLVVELRHDVPADDAAEAAIASLERLGVLREGARPRVVSAWRGASFTLPDADNAERFEQAATALSERLPRSHVVGPATAFGADSLNEQVVQGLHAAEVHA